MNNNFNSLVELVRKTATGLFSKLQNMFSLSLFAAKEAKKRADNYYTAENLAGAFWEETDLGGGLNLRNYQDLSNDREIVINCVKENGLALQYADYSLQEDEEVVKLACTDDPKAFQFAAEHLKSNYDFVKAMYAVNPATFEHAADAIKNDMVFLEELSKIDPERSFKQYLSDEVSKEYGEEGPKSPGP